MNNELGKKEMHRVISRQRTFRYYCVVRLSRGRGGPAGGDTVGHTPVTSASVVDKKSKYLDSLWQIARRMPNQRAGDVDKRFLGRWIANNTVSEGETNSKRVQLMRRKIPLAFANR